MKLEFAFGHKFLIEKQAKESHKSVFSEDFCLNALVERS